MWLKFESGDRRGDTVEITNRQFLVGRDQDCDLPIDDERASRQHARFETLDTGGMVLRDLGATNGTYVNGTKISEPVVLEGGETIRIGRTELAVSRNAPIALDRLRPGHEGRRGSCRGGRRSHPIRSRPQPLLRPSSARTFAVRSSARPSSHPSPAASPSCWCSC